MIDVDDLIAIKEACENELYGNTKDNELDRVKEKFDKIDKTFTRETKLLAEKELIEKQYCDNAILQRYVKIIKELEKITQLQNSSKELYEEFERLELPRLTGKNCELVLTKTYMKTQINSKQFLTDFKPDSKMYQKYVEQKPVKGHLSLKRLNG